MPFSFQNQNWKKIGNISTLCVGTAEVNLSKYAISNFVLEVVRKSAARPPTDGCNEIHLWKKYVVSEETFICWC